MDWIVLDVMNPKREEEGDAVASYNIRVDKVRDIVDGLVDTHTSIAGTNAEVRADKEALEFLMSQLDPKEVALLTKVLIEGRENKAKPKPKAAAAAPRQRVVGRPPAHNFSYGGISTRAQGMGGSYQQTDPISFWDDLASLAEMRERTFGGKGQLVPINTVVEAIKGYAQQSEWARDASGRFTVRPIQGATLPCSLRGYNLVATAETGSGKTMCFAVVAVCAVVPAVAKTQVLIMAHNRTLLDQLCEEMDKLCTSTGNQVRWAFADSKDRGGGRVDPTAHILLATAMQMRNAVRDIDLAYIRLIVADEVDDIFSQNDTDKVIQELIDQTTRRAGRRPQVMFFSATIGDDENDPEDRRLRMQLENCLGPAHIICKAERKDVAGMTHVFIACNSPQDKANVLPWLLTDPMLVGSAIVFCQRKKGTATSVESLIERDNDARRRLNKQEIQGEVGVDLLSGVQEFTAGAEITKDQRIKMMRRFKENKARVLVATDAVAKGIDVPNVTMVCQVELVKCVTEGKDAFSWLKTQNKALDQFRHRAGRTARSLQKGINVVLITPQEQRLAEEYVRILRVPPDNLRFIRAEDREQLRTYIQEAQL
mmetsp:Transcript_34185/g.80991  ORF Transcript_34185/g.80991 Transcript_34185/m.80991 type:complete len:596 (+) Transcript_34185:460-2247(+)